MRIYFAHPFATIGTEDEARIIAELKKRGEEIHNPFEDDKDKEWMKRFRTGEFSIKDAIRLVEVDLAAIDRSDAVLVWLPTGIYTCGTICEMVYTYYSNIHTIVIHSEGRRVNPWVWYHASELYLTVEDWIEDKGIQMSGIGIDGNQRIDKIVCEETHESKDYQQ